MREIVDMGISFVGPPRYLGVPRIDDSVPEEVSKPFLLAIYPLASEASSIFSLTADMHLYITTAIFTNNRTTGTGACMPTIPFSTT